MALIYEHDTSKIHIALSNTVINAVFNLSIDERRLLLVALSRIKPHTAIEPNQPFYIYKDDFVRMGVDPSNATKSIKNACKSLQASVVPIPTLLGDLEVNWFDSVLYFKTEKFIELKRQYPNSKYDEDFISQLRLHNLLEALEFIMKSDRNVMARIVFHEKIIPYISELKSEFTRLNYEQAFILSTEYSFRIFAMMMIWQNTIRQIKSIHAHDEHPSNPCFYMTIADFREKLELGDKYKNMKDLKKWVIEPALAEIVEKTDYEILNFQYEMSGERKHTGIYFEYKLKSSAIKQIKQAPADPYLNFKMSEKQVNFFNWRIAQHLGLDKETVAQELVNPFTQSKYVDALKHFEYKPHDWFNQDELKAFQEQRNQAHADKLAKEKEQAQELELALDVYNDLLKADDETVEWFVTANQRFFGSFGAEKHHFDRGEYRLCLQAMKFRFENLSMFRQFDLSML